jgi:hypothetical protein
VSPSTRTRRHPAAIKRAKVKALRDQGLSASAVAALLGISRRYVMTLSRQSRELEESLAPQAILPAALHSMLKTEVLPAARQLVTALDLLLERSIVMAEPVTDPEPRPKRPDGMRALFEGTCSVCGSPISKGDQIVRAIRAAGPLAGWAHTGCSQRPEGGS